MLILDVSPQNLGKTPGGLLEEIPETESSGVSRIPLPRVSHRARTVIAKLDAFGLGASQ
ncbi:hypothetical protein chiPu_0023788, partial [Chiloscyllium punctatum]|nr:hypothetical protein [Chiloscyllium punctatum]